MWVQQTVDRARKADLVLRFVDMQLVDVSMLRCRDCLDID